MNIGVPKESRERASQSQFGDVISLSKLDPGSYVFRFVSGVERVERIFWPMMAENEDGELEASWRSVVCPSEPTILDKLAQLDRRIQIDAGVDPRGVGSRLDRGTKFLYLGFDRRDSKPEIKQIEVGWQVHKALNEMEAAPDIKDPTKKLNGLLFMFDVIVKKTQDRSRPGFFGIGYSASPVPNNPFAGKVPAAWNVTEDVPSFDYVKKGIFTEGEQVAIDSCSISLAEEAEPTTPEELMDRLREFPIDLSAMDGSKPIFYDSDALRAKLEELEEFVLGAGKLLEAGTDFPPQSPPAEEEVGETDKALDWTAEGFAALDLFPDAGEASVEDLPFEEVGEEAPNMTEGEKRAAEEVPGLEDIKAKEKKQSLQAKVETARKAKEVEEKVVEEPEEKPEEYEQSSEKDEGILRW